MEEPREVVVRWPDDASPYRLRIWFGQLDGRPAVVGVEMWGCTPRRQPWPEELDALEPAAQTSVRVDKETAITSAAIRLPLGRILDSWVDIQRSLMHAHRELRGNAEGQDARIDRFERRLGEQPPRGRPRLSDEFLSKVARVYIQAQQSADDFRRPAAAVQRELGANTRETARSWIKQARRRGVLPSADSKPGQEHT